MQSKCMAMHAILKVRPKPHSYKVNLRNIFMQWIRWRFHWHRFLNQKRFLSLDLTYGYPLNVTMYEYLLQNGMTKEDYMVHRKPGKGKMHNG